MIESLPTECFRRYRLDGTSANATTISPQTLRTQTIQFPGQIYTATVTVPHQRQPFANKWIGFFRRMNHNGGTFWLPAPSFQVSTKEVGRVRIEGEGQAGNTVNLRGFVPNLTEAFTAGQMFAINGRLYEFTGQVDSDAEGKVTAGIWPALYQGDADDGDDLEYLQPKGEFRMVESSFEANWALPNILSEFVFSAVQVV